MRPIYKLLVDGNPLTLHNRLISMSLIDKNGMEVDELTLELDDSDGQLEMPSKGKELELIFGFAGQEQNRGKYIVDERSHRGPPDVISIRARSADFKKSLLEEREKSYHEQTIGGILGEIAQRHQLETAISPELARLPVEHIDQTNESDANLISRLAKEHDAVGTIKSGKLIFTARAMGKTASGKDLPMAIINRQDNDSHDFNDADRDERVTGVAAYYHDKKQGKRHKASVGKKGYQRHLKRTYNSEAEAKTAAAAEAKRIKTRALKLTLNLAVGRADLFAEQPVRVNGFKREIDAVNWFIKEITHNLNEQGYSCTLQLEELAGNTETVRNTKHHKKITRRAKTKARKKT